MSRALLRKCLAPTVWLSGRLSFSRKFMLVGVVVLVALGVLSEPLLRASMKNSALVRSERAGLARLSSQVGLLDALVGLRSAAAATDDGARPLAWQALAPRLAAFIDEARGDGLDELAERLVRNGRQLDGIAGDTDPQRAFAAYTGAINTTLALMRETARVHRLNVDAEFDATFDMLAGRLPLMLETLAKQRDALALGSEAMASYALGAQVILTEAGPGLKAGVAQLAAATPAGAQLRSELERFLVQVAAQQDAVDKVIDDPAAVDELRTLATANVALAGALLQAAIDASDRALQHRLSLLQRDQIVIATLLVGAIAAIAYLFAGIYLSTRQSLKSLAEGTAAFCAGKLDTRIRIDTRDELVLVARNFNTVAAEFSRLLAVIHEQNESRQRELAEMVLARTRELADKNEQLQATHARVREELKLARNMQLAILPQHSPDEPGWSVAACMHPAREMGGDFYDHFTLADGRYGVLVADVSGKGVAAAFFMAVSRTVLLDLATQGEAPARVLARANDLLCERNPLELFVTVFYAIYDPRDGSLDYACAGHNPPLQRHTDRRVTALPCPQDIALGVLPGMDYTDARTVLAPGEVLLLFTDGVTEAFSAAGEAYGEARLSAWLAARPAAASAAELVAGIVDEIGAFVDGAEPSDDLTCLVLSRKTERRPMVHSIPSRLEEIGRLADLVDAALADRPELAFSGNLCLEELITNTIVHGLGGAPDHFIEVRLSCDDTWLTLSVRDDAPPFDPFVEAPAPDLDADLDARPIGGLGVHLIRSLMDEVSTTHDGNGNRVVLRKRL